MVRRIDDERVVAPAPGVERVEDRADLLVDELDRREVRGPRRRDEIGAHVRAPEVRRRVARVAERVVHRAYVARGRGDVPAVVRDEPRWRLGVVEGREEPRRGIVRRVRRVERRFQEERVAAVVGDDLGRDAARPGRVVPGLGVRVRGAAPVVVRQRPARVPAGRGRVPPLAAGRRVEPLAVLVPLGLEAVVEVVLVEAVEVLAVGLARAEVVLAHRDRSKARRVHGFGEL